MTILGKCSCNADCEMHGPDCEGFVKPIGHDSMDQWVHSCKTHHDALVSRDVKHAAATKESYDWDMRGPG